MLKRILVLLALSSIATFGLAVEKEKCTSCAPKAKAKVTAKKAEAKKACKDCKDMKKGEKTAKKEGGCKCCAGKAKKDPFMAEAERMTLAAEGKKPAAEGCGKCKMEKKGAKVKVKAAAKPVK